MTTTEPGELTRRPAPPVDPLGDAEAMAEAGRRHNFAKVGSARPTSLLYTYGPGSIIDLPHFTVLPMGLDSWERVWQRRSVVPTVHAPRLLDQVRRVLGPQVREIRPFPWQAVRTTHSREGADLGVPTIVFPQWLRCTGCDLLAPLSRFDYVNTHPFRTDEARFEHPGCAGRAARGRDARTQARSAKKVPPTAVPARYLLVCVDGHLDEFPYELWVHRGARCDAAEVPALAMTDSTGGGGSSATVRCRSCDARRGMNEAQGEAGRRKLPLCRGRHPHLDGYDRDCTNETRLMLVGASNLWFPATMSIVVMPTSPAERRSTLADALHVALGEDRLRRYAADVTTLRDVAEGRLGPEHDLPAVTDDELAAAVSLALDGDPEPEEADERPGGWDPVVLLAPEWEHLQRVPQGQRHREPQSGLTVSPQELHPSLAPSVQRVLAVEQLRKVNAVLGFTRVDDLDRIGDWPARLGRLTVDGRPRWTVGTEDLGEGVFLQLDEAAVASWEARVEDSEVWEMHREAHRRNAHNRWSDTTEMPDPDHRLPPPRYWLLHTLAHVLIREMAMTSGYGAASLSERIYAWQAAPGREPAAGLLITTTASDSEGTLGGLVRLSRPDRLAPVLRTALLHAERCSSDPVCAHRLPKEPEDFLHGAACHCCSFASETSCERSNRFLDRRFLVPLPGSDLAFFAGDRFPGS